MKNKKDLAKIALAALILASATPVTGHADMDIEVQGILLAAGCPAHGCANASTPANNNSAPVSNPNSRNYNGQPYGGIPAGNQPGGYNGSPNGVDNASSGGYRRPATDGYNNSSDNYNSYGNPSYSGYNAPSGSPASYSYEDNRVTNYGSRSSEYGMTGSNRGNVTDANYNDNAAAGITSSATLTEAQLLGMLSPQGRAIYLSLDPESKALAIQLASQDSYRDKNLAVKEAQRRMNERRNFNR